MRIAQIAPLYESVPPRLYGGTDRVVSYLTEELVRQGHQVTLFASEDSITSAELVPCTSRALRLEPNVRDPVPHHMIMLDHSRAAGPRPQGDPCALRGALLRRPYDNRLREALSKDAPRAHRVRRSALGTRRPFGRHQRTRIRTIGRGTEG